MGKNSKPKCGTCEVLCPYQSKCVIPLEPECGTQDMYVSYDGKSKRCKSVYISRKYSLVTDSHHKFKGTVGVNDGVPTGLWNSVSCRPFVNYQVPFFLKESNGSVQNDNIIVLSQLFDGAPSMTAIANPVLGLDTNTTLIGDSSDSFVKGVFSIFPITASQFDVEDTVTMYKIVQKGSYRLRVTVQATKIVDDSVPDDTLFTKIVAIDDITSCDYRVPLCFTTYKLCPLGTGAPFGVGTENIAPVFMTFVKNACCEYSVGFFHGLAAGFPAGQLFPDDSVDTTVHFELPSYSMVGANENGCPFVSPASLSEMYGDLLARKIYADQTSVAASTAELILEIAATPVLPGDLTNVQKDLLVHANSEALVDTWRQGVNSFNATMEGYVTSLAA